MTFSEGQVVGSVYGSTLKVFKNSDGKLVLGQVMTATNGKPGVVWRGGQMLLAANTNITKISGITDSDATQFLQSTGDTQGNSEPTGVSVSGYVYSYTETGGTRINQLSSDIASAAGAAAAQSVISGNTTVDTNTGLVSSVSNTVTRSTNVISDFFTTSPFMAWGLVAVVAYFLFFHKTGHGRRKKHGLLGL